MAPATSIIEPFASHQRFMLIASGANHDRFLTFSGEN